MAPPVRAGLVGSGGILPHGPARQGGDEKVPARQGGGGRGARPGGAPGERRPCYCIMRSSTSYNACVHAVMPNPRTRYNAEKNSPATMRNANE